MSEQKRKYEKRARAEAEAQTRRRITESAVELHGTLGPARTTMSAVAERAGVRRSTLYRHFPDERALFGACSAHWAGENPPPDIGRWGAIEDPAARLDTALSELYAYYRRGRGLRGNAARRTRAAIGHALAFRTWQDLSRGQGLDDRGAVELMSRLVSAVV